MIELLIGRWTNVLKNFRNFADEIGDILKEQQAD